jgi:hypothetical protein
LFPALYNLMVEGFMQPACKILGVARRPYQDNEFRDAVRQAVRKCQWAAEQIPLPEPLPQQPVRQQQQPTAPTGAGGKKTFDSLPQIGGK